MTSFKTIQSIIFSRFKNQKTSTVYDVLRPIFYCSILFGITPFNVTVKKFRNCVWLVLWNGLIFISSTILALIALNTREIKRKVTMHDIANIVLGWAGTINNEIVIVFGFISKNKVNLYSQMCI